MGDASTARLVLELQNDQDLTRNDIVVKANERLLGRKVSICFVMKIIGLYFFGETPIPF